MPSPSLLPPPPPSSLSLTSCCRRRICRRCHRRWPGGGGCSWRLLHLGACGTAVATFPRQQCNRARAVVASAAAWLRGCHHHCFCRRLRRRHCHCRRVNAVKFAVVATAGGLAAAVVAGGCCIMAHAARRWQLFRGSSATELGRWWRLQQLGCGVGGGSLAAGADLHCCCGCCSTASALPPPLPPLPHCRHFRAIIMVRTTECII